MTMSASRRVFLPLAVGDADRDGSQPLPYYIPEIATAAITLLCALVVYGRWRWLRRQQQPHLSVFTASTRSTAVESTAVPLASSLLSVSVYITGTTLLSILFLIQQHLDLGKQRPPIYLPITLLVQSIAWTLWCVSVAKSSGRGAIWLPSRVLLAAVTVSTCLECLLDALDLFGALTAAEPDHAALGWPPAVPAWTPNGWSVALLAVRGTLQLTLLALAHISAQHYTEPAPVTYQPIDADAVEPDTPEATTSDEAKMEDGARAPKTTQRSGVVGWREYIQRMRTLLPFMWPTDNRQLQVMILLSGLMLVAGRVVNVLVPVQYKRLVDALGGSGDAPRFAWPEVLWYVGYRLLQGSGGLVYTAQTFLWIPVGQYTTRKVAVKMFSHLHNLSLRYHLNRKTGEVLRVQDRGVQSIVSLLQAIVFQLFPTMVDIIVACIYFAYTFDLYFASVVLTTMVGYMVATIAITDWRMQFRRESNDKENTMQTRAVDSLLNFETVKYYGAEDFEVHRYDVSLGEFLRASWKSSVSLSILNMAQSVIIQGGLLIGMLVCAYRVVQGTMTVGGVVLYLSYILQLYGPLNWFGTYYRMMQRNFVDMEKMLDLFEEHIEVRDLPGAVPLQVSQGSVEFKNVSFGYDARQPILHDLTFKVPGGSTVAFVGESGAGKSTILRLLFRFYDVDSGAVLVDGQDVRYVRQTDLRASIGVVPQDTVLFNDTIRYNIRYARINASDDEVDAAARAAQIHDRILTFPDGIETDIWRVMQPDCSPGHVYWLGYETRVGERGLRLSGGEKQRVAIARTLLKNPPIVLLDEATSALDTTTERNIQAALNKVTANRTTIIIAHRLSTIIHADTIFVMHEGRIVESGTHKELLQMCENGRYYDLWMKQLREEKKKAAEQDGDDAEDQPNLIDLDQK